MADSLDFNPFHPTGPFLARKLIKIISGTFMLLLQRFHLWSLKWVFARSHIRSHHLGENLSCSLYTELGWLYCIEMVGPVCQYCHFPCLGGLPSLTLCANGTVARELGNFTMFFSDLFWIFPRQPRGTAAARPGRGASYRSICHNMNFCFVRETAGWRLGIAVYAGHFSHGLKKLLNSTPLEH